MSLRLPNSTRRASLAELMPWFSGEELAHCLVGYGFAGCAAAGNTTVNDNAIASRAFESRGIIAHAPGRSTPSLWAVAGPLNRGPHFTRRAAAVLAGCSQDENDAVGAALPATGASKAEGGLVQGMLRRDPAP